MERSDFNAALEDRSKLLAQSNEAWEELAKKYPYATLLQLLQAQRKGNLSDAEKKGLLIHFENPLHLSSTITMKALPDEVDAKKEEALDGKAEVKEEGPIDAPKLEEEVAAVVEPVKQEVIKELAKEEVETVQKEEPKQEKTVADTEDVLELINKLPEESPIKRKEEPAAELEPQEAVAESQDPGDLMVMMSFTDWLNHFKAKSENEAEEKKGKDAIRSAWQKEKLAEAMDDEEDVVPDEIFEKAMKSVSFGDGLVTEPLAEVYVQQGKTEKAIELYKKLSLLNPEKRTYFASRIKDLHLLK